MNFVRKLILPFLLVSSMASPAIAQPAIPSGQVDIFMGLDFNYRDIWFNRLFDVLVNLTPGVKWNMGKGWQASAQALIPVYNDYGDRYDNVRLNMATLSKEMYFHDGIALKVSGGLFSEERYGVDIKAMWAINRWLAFELQTGVTGYCSMADGWEASSPGRWTGLAGADFYIHPYDTEFRVRGGRYIYTDYGGIVEAMRHFKHCTVGFYGQYSSKSKASGGFKVIVMLPPYKRSIHTVNFRPASNFRLTYNNDADAYSNRMYTTDPEENEREGWFDNSRFLWGRNTTQQDFTEKVKQVKEEQK